MDTSLKKLSIASRGLHYKIGVAFCLVSVIPLLSCIYFIANYVLKNVQTVWETGIIIFITVAIIIMGLHLIRDITNSIVKISKEAKAISAGDSYLLIETNREDEIGELGTSLNTLIKRMKEKIDELYNLSRIVENSKIKDDLTSLYNERYIKERLSEEIKRAITYQRPCSFILFSIDDFIRFKQLGEGSAITSALKKLANIFSQNITEIDRAARIGDDRFAILLPEKNKRQAIQIADQICKRIEKVFKDETGPSKGLTVSGGVSENPIDGNIADEIFSKADAYLAEAMKDGKNRVVG